MIDIARKVLNPMSVIELKLLDLQSETKTKAPEGPVVRHGQFLLPQVIVAETQAQIFPLAKKEFATEYEVS